MRDGRAGIDAALVRRLVRAQLPQWGDLPVTPVEVDGWDNRTYRLGDELSVRLPTASGYAAAVEKEHRWLPVLAPRLPLPVPQPVALGRPTEEYPHPWSVRRWLPGDTARPDLLDDPVRFALDVAGFVRALWAVDAHGGPVAGAHSFFRGAPPVHYDAETRRALDALDGRVDRRRATAVWQDALAAPYGGRDVWFHGDIAPGNLLVRDGRLAAVIDFGTSGVGDPACDLVLAWTFLTGRSRAAFRDATAQDAGTWARARGWALWKALITEDLRVVAEVLADA